MTTINEDIMRDFASILDDAKELRALKMELNADYSKADIDTWNARISRAEDVLDRFVQLGEPTGIRAIIPEFTLLNDGSNPQGYRACAARSGDRGIYEEVRIGIFHPDGHCVGDVLVGLTADGEPRVMLTSDGNGDDEPSHAFYPLREPENAIESLDAMDTLPAQKQAVAVVDQILDCSTAHVSRETMHELLSMAKRDGSAWMVSAYSEGCIVGVHEDAEGDNDLPEDLQAVMAFARKNGCHILRLDGDGTRYTNLPEFDWESSENKTDVGMSPG